MSRIVEISPHPAGTLEALSGSGYTLHTAVADLVDNCAASGATEIDIRLEADTDFRLVITDNGRGMSEAELVEAMRIGTRYGETRSAGDLGRFGTGMKAAALSLSAAGRFSVVSSPRDGSGTRATLDTAAVRLAGRWIVSVEPAPDASTGSSVIIDAPTIPRDSAASQILMGLADHLRVTHATLLEGDLTIRVQGHPLAPWSLCAMDLPGVSPLSTRQLAGGRVRVTVLILPTHTDVPGIEGPLGRAAHAGLHVHRAGRAITSGGWSGLRLPARSRIARDRIRVLIEIGTELDTEWGISLTKSACRVPASIGRQLRVIVEGALERAGRRRTTAASPAGSPSGDRVWDQGAIRRDHPLVRAVMGQSSDPTDVERLLARIEGER